MIKKYLFFIFLSTFGNTQFAECQQIKYSQHEVALDEALGEKQVKTVVKDKNGYYWLLTPSQKILKWNGHDFTKIDSLPAYHLSLKNIYFELLHDNNGKPFFFETDKATLYIDDNSQLKIRTTNNKISKTRISYRGSFNTLQKSWDEIKTLNPTSVFNKFYKAYNSIEYSTVYGDGDDIFYLFGSGCIQYYSHGLIKEIRKIDVQNVLTFAIDTSLVLFMNEGYEVYRHGKLAAAGSLSNAKFPEQFLKRKNGHRMWGLIQNGDSTLFAFDSCIYMLTLKNNKPLLRKYFSISYPNLYFDFYCDVENERIFLLKIKGGFTYFDREKIIAASKPGIINEDLVHTIVNTSGGKLLTNNFFQHAINPCSVCPFVWANISAAGFLNGNYYYFINNGAYIINGAGHIVQKLPIEIGTQTFSAVSSDTAVYFQNGKLYAVSNNNGNAKIVELPFYDNGTKLSIDYIENGGNHILYAASNTTNHIYRLDTKNLTVKKISTAPITKCRSIYYNQKLNILLVSTTGKGLFAISIANGMQVALPLDANECLLFCHYAIADKEGDFWLPTNSGLFYLSGEELALFLQGKIKSLPYKQIEKEFNTQAIEYNGAFSSAGLVRDDSAFFSSMEGIVGIKPAYLKSLFKKEGPTPTLDEIQIDGQLSNINDLKNISPSYKRLDFKFSIPYIQYPGIKLQFRIEGARDSGWGQIQDGKLMLNYLSPGSYTLQVKATGANSGRIQNFQIIIKEYWYNTLLAKLVFIVSACIFIIVLIGYQYQKIRNNSLKEIDSNREQFFHIVAHDLRSPINFFQGLAEIASYLIHKKDFEGLTKVSEEIDETGRKLNMLLTNLLQWSLVEQKKLIFKTDKVVLKNLLAEIVPIYEKIAAAKGISIEQRIDDNIIFDADSKIISIIIRNLLDNSLKYAVPNSDLLIESNMNKSTFHFMIGNSFFAEKKESLEKIAILLNGKSNLEKEQAMGFGLKIIKQIVVALNGNVIVKLKDNHVMFHIAIPLK